MESKGLTSSTEAMIAYGNLMAQKETIGKRQAELIAQLRAEAADAKKGTTQIIKSPVTPASLHKKS